MKYIHLTEGILEAFHKAYESAQANYESASALAERNLYGPATSLAVLSLEEVGKMILLDGLLFARKDDERYKAYEKRHLRHKMKLDALEIYPLFLGYVSLIDSRQDEKRYKQTMVIIINDLKAKRQKLIKLFGESFALADLDSLKQKGFYSHEENGYFKSNKEGIQLEEAKAVIDLAWRVTDSLKFVLGKHMDGYKERFITYRKGIDEEALQEMRKEAEIIVKNVFENDGES